MTDVTLSLQRSRPAGQALAGRLAKPRRRPEPGEPEPKHPADDQGGRGREIVREALACGPCAAGRDAVPEVRSARKL